MSQIALAPGHAREYETVYILRPNTNKDDAEGVASRMVDAIKGGEGKLTAAELWGQRLLAYPIAKHHRGIYVYLKYLGRGETVAEIERQLRLNDAVIRYQTIQLRDDVKLASEGDGKELSLDFEVPFEEDAPELSRERELGLERHIQKAEAQAQAEEEGAEGEAAEAAGEAPAEKTEEAAAEAKPAEAEKGEE